MFHAGLYPDKPDEGVNEGGVKRYRSFRKHAERLGYEVQYDPGDFQGSPGVVSSEDDFENRLWALLLFPRGPITSEGRDLRWPVGAHLP